MNATKLFPVLLATVLITASGWSLAAEGDASSQHHPQSEQSMKAMPEMNSGMMGRGMMGGMMGGCPMMAQLPSGNAKLTMQMHGEMMEAMGKILVKYADKIQPQQSK